MKKLLVTGANGFVAGSILRQATGRWELHGIARTELSGNPPAVTNHLIDLLDSAAVERLFFSIRPDAVIHTAAIANIDYCQHHQQEAEAINVGVTRLLTKCCAETGTRLIHCSTDTVFDGQRGNYKEEDETGPVNFYAETKIRAEQIVLGGAADNVVARLALVIGLRSTEKGNSFLSDLIGQWQKSAAVRFAVNEIRTPVDVMTLGAALLELATRPELSGIFHLAGDTKIDRYQMGLLIAEALNFSAELAQPVNSNVIPGRAPRPDDASLDNSKAKRWLKTPMRSFTDALNGILKSKKEETQ